MLILLGLMAVLESVVVFLLSSGIVPMVAIGRAALALLKSKTGSTLAKAVSAALVVLFASNISNVFRVQKGIAKMGAVQVDQSIIRSQLLEITLIGYCLLLGLMMTSLDSSLKQVDALTWNINVPKKQAKGKPFFLLKCQVVIDSLVRSCCVFSLLFIAYWVSPILVNSGRLGLL
jgi:hypothetical protein